MSIAPAGEKAMRILHRPLGVVLRAGATRQERQQPRGNRQRGQRFQSHTPLPETLTSPFCGGFASSMAAGPA